MTNEEWKKHKDSLRYRIYTLLMPPITPEKLEEAYEMGMIRKIDLKDKVEYYGTCRNANTAIWHADKERFTYIREKFGSTFPEDIVHPEDDEKFDIFVPVQEV